jgi:hypothetical protein
MAVHQRAFRVRRPAADVRAATVAALANGGVIHSPIYASWGIAGRCIRPVHVEQIGEHHMELSLHNGQRQLQTGRTLGLEVACRQCRECLKTRQRLWGNRAVQEWKDSPRTWFGTLTFSPSERYRLQLLTRRRLERQGVTLEELTPVERFREQAKETGKEVQDFIRRLRRGSKRQKRPPAVFRFFLAIEPHKDWTPHYHVLVHEVSEALPVTKATLEVAWPLGFTQWRLVKDARAAFYAAKYLGKYSVARVRASEFYGDEITERLRSFNTGPQTVKNIDPPNKSLSPSLRVLLADAEMTAAKEAAWDDAVMGTDL